MLKSLKKKLLKIKFFSKTDALIRSILAFIPILHTKFIKDNKINEIEHIFIFLHGGIGDICLRVPLLNALSESYRVTVMLPPSAVKVVVQFCPKVECHNYDESRGIMKLISSLRRMTSSRTLFFCTSSIIESYILFLISRCRIAFGFIGTESVVRAIGLQIEPEYILEKNKYKRNQLIYRKFAKIFGLEREYLQEPKLILNRKSNSIIIAPNKTEGWPAGRWHKNNFISLIDQIDPIFSGTIKIVGTQSEAAYADSIISSSTSKKLINLSGETSIEQLIIELSNAQLVVSNDSGIMHLSALVGTPCIAIFSFSDPEVFAWPGLTHTFFNQEYPCMPCVSLKSIPQDNYPFVCPFSSRCDGTVNVEEVLNATLRYLV